MLLDVGRTFSGCGLIDGGRTESNWQTVGFEELVFVDCTANVPVWKGMG